MQRRFFVTSDRRKPEKGRHLSYIHHVEGKYAFKKYQGGDDGAQKLKAYKQITKELQEIIKEAIASGKEVRAQGSSWSLSKVGLAKDRLINTKLLRFLRFDMPKVLLSSRYRGDSTKLQFVECGESISAINQMLFKQGLSLKTSGSNNGQTLAGALSTGTHGSAFGFGAVPDFVVGLHLVVGPSKHVYLQRATAPVVKKRFADSLGATFEEDDELFNAALVSFGSFGIIQGVLIETRELFALHATRFFHPFNAGLKAAIESLDFSGIDFSKSLMPPSVPKDRPHHFQVYFNPNERMPPKRAAVLMMFEDDWERHRDGYVRPEWDDGDAGPTASGLEIVGALFSHLPKVLTEALLPGLNSQVDDQLEPFYHLGTIRDLFRGEKVVGKLLVSGTAVPRERALEALNIAFKTYDDFPRILPVIISSRFIKGTQALLGFTKFRENCTVEIDTINTPESRRLLNQVRKNFAAADIPFTVHWGKIESFLTARRLEKIYEGNLQAWLRSREHLLENAETQRVFTNAFMTRLGLA